MSEFYRPQKKASSLYDPASEQPFVLSRARVELFILCPRCFYLEHRKGTARVPGYPFNLNSAVDKLLKSEFDAHRAAQTAHPYMLQHGIDAIPFNHPELAKWQEALHGGVRFHHTGLNLILRGAPDDIWVTPRETLHVADYKATSQDNEITLESAWKDGYKRQIEFYQWLLRQNGFTVEKTAYFVYANGDRNAPAFDDKIEFRVKVLPYEGDDSWVEPTVRDAKQCLDAPGLPEPAASCDWCAYRKSAATHEQAAS